MELIGRTEMQIAAPSDRVWAMLADIAGWRAWMPGVRWAVLEGAFGAGAYVTVIPSKGRRQTAFRIDAAAPPLILALGFTIGPVAALRRTWLIEPAGGGTRIIYTLEIDGPLRRFLTAGIATSLHAAAPAMLEALRSALE
jgi:carbon monoxide dehydrogenase subunit G